MWRVIHTLIKAGFSDDQLFVVEMITHGEETLLQHRSGSEDTLAIMAFLASKGWAQKDIADKLKISQGYASKKIAATKEQNILTNSLKLTEWGEAVCASLREE
jgi:hypothetical protein